jgi:hypothetical protein
MISGKDELPWRRPAWSSKASPWRTIRITELPEGRLLSVEVVLERIIAALLSWLPRRGRPHGLGPSSVDERLTLEVRSCWELRAVIDRLVLSWAASPLGSAVGEGANTMDEDFDEDVP